MSGTIMILLDDNTVLEGICYKHGECTGDRGTNNQFCIDCGHFDWNWLLETRKAAALERIAEAAGGR